MCSQSCKGCRLVNDLASIVAGIYRWIATAASEVIYTEASICASQQNWPPYVRYGGRSQPVDATLYPERERWSVRQCVEVIFEALRHRRKQSFGIAGSGASR